MGQSNVNRIVCINFVTSIFSVLTIYEGAVVVHRPGGLVIS